MADTKLVVEAPLRPYGTGWKVDAESSLSRSAGPATAHLGAPNNIPPECFALLPFAGAPNDQKETSTCTGQAIGKAIKIRLGKLGFDPNWDPSYLGIYAVGKRREMKEQGASEDEPIVDDGCVPTCIMEGIRDVGVPDSTIWPWDPKKAETDVDLAVLKNASKLRVFRWHRMTEDGIHRSDAIANAISKGYPVPFGLRIWQSFFSYKDGTIEKADSDDAGGHMLCIVAYRTRADGTREFMVLNSWGSWGMSGYFWIHESVLALDRASDFFVMEVSQ